MKKIVGIIFISLFISSCSSTKNVAEDRENIKGKIEKRDYTIDVNFATPLRGRLISLGGSSYSLKLKNDSAFAHLPYFGVAYAAPYGSPDGGIKFEEPIKDYNIQSNKRNDGWIVSFNIDTKDYNYRIQLDVFENGSSNIVVSSYQRDQISFRGHIK